MTQISQFGNSKPDEYELPTPNPSTGRYSVSVTQGLTRYQQAGDLHFVTFSCYQQRPYLETPAARSLFEDALERIRKQHSFSVFGYVVMPEHVHLLLSEPPCHSLASSLKSLKLSVTLRTKQRPFWQPRYYDFNVFSDKKRIEKLRYIHRNPVARGLVSQPEDWAWSSFLHYSSGARGAVEDSIANSNS